MRDIDIVYTVDDYWDGPREGIASFRGKPHAYRCLFDEAQDEWSERYRLTPISPDALEAALEAWGIWCRWASADRAGQAPRGSHPALPHESERYFHLKAVVDSAVNENETQAFIAHGEFATGASAGSAIHGDPGSLTVVWRVEAAA